MSDPKNDLPRLKTGLAEMLKGGTIMDVTDAAQAKIAEDAGDIGAHHGIALFAVTQIISVLPHLLHSAKEIHEGRESLGQKGEAAGDETAD